MGKWPFIKNRAGKKTRRWKVHSRTGPRENNFLQLRATKHKKSKVREKGPIRQHQYIPKQLNNLL